MAAGGHCAHGAHASGPTAEEFKRSVEEFVERYRLPDGTVHPRISGNSTTTFPRANGLSAGVGNSAVVGGGVGNSTVGGSLGSATAVGVGIHRH